MRTRKETTALAEVDVRNAKLPVNYEHAKTALGECYRMDECKDWKDKAAAMASYAKQAHDETLYKTAMKIQGRALRRYGELQAQIPEEPGKGGGRPSKTSGGRPPEVSARAQANRDAGMSPDQAKNAMRIASIPEDMFEAAIEDEAGPPTITQLAEMGTKKREPKVVTPADVGLPDDYLRGLAPEVFSAAIQAHGWLEEFAKKCGKVSAKDVAQADMNHDRQSAVLRHMRYLDAQFREIRGQLLAFAGQCTLPREDRDALAHRFDTVLKGDSKHPFDESAWYLHEIKPN